MSYIHNSKDKDYNTCYKPCYCLIIFVILFIPIFFIAVFLQKIQPFLFHISLFITGWFAWTFFEYMTHRYMMHSKKDSKLPDFNHTHHHTHPSDIKISGTQRSLLIICCVILLLISVWLGNYFTIVAGFLCGFPVYTVMHFLLHQKMMQRFFKKMVSYHIYHHCKYPDTCFGISVTWWDDLFGTIPQNPGLIPKHIIDFYFTHKNRISNTVKTQKLIQL